MHGSKLNSFVVAALALCCASQPEDGSALCTPLEGHVSACATPNACELALVRDCAALQSSVTADFAEQAGACLNNLGHPQTCLSQASAGAMSSLAVEAFATDFCLECSTETSTCQREVLSASNTNAGRAGRLARVLSEQALTEVTLACATGESCLDAFETCAKQALGRLMPPETASCLVNSAIQDIEPVCGDEQVANTPPADTGGPANDDDDDEQPLPDEVPELDPTCDQVECPCERDDDCAGSLQCPAGACMEPLVCEQDRYEPNNGERQATFLDPLIDGSDGATVEGLLDSPSDIDWFRYEGSDETFGIVGPGATININVLQLCIYAECLNGLDNTNVTCPAGTTQQPSPGGLPGCCANGSTGFQINMNCGGWVTDNDSAFIYISVTDAQPGICQQYAVSYYF